MSDWARVARITKTRNLEGSLVLRSVDGLPFLLSPQMEVRFVPPTLRGPFGGAVASVREFREGSFEVAFDSVRDVRTAETLVGSYCLVRKADLPDIDRLEEPATLVGWRVVDDEWGDLGAVADVDETSLQARLVVRGTAGEVLIPLVDAFVADFSEADHTISVHIPQGLLDLARSNAHEAGE